MFRCKFVARLLFSARGATFLTCVRLSYTYDLTHAQGVTCTSQGDHLCARMRCFVRCQCFSICKHTSQHLEKASIRATNLDTKSGRITWIGPIADCTDRGSKHRC